MPTMISDNHHTFMKNFIQTGENRLIDQNKNLFIKTKEGTVIPVQMTLFVTFMNYSSMTLFFNATKNSNLFDHEEDEILHQKPAYLLLNEDFKVYDASETMHQVCHLS